MVKRKKRLKKGIKSLEKQISIHKDKKEKALKEGKLERVGYYAKEIRAKEKDRDKKERQSKKR